MRPAELIIAASSIAPLALLIGAPSAAVVPVAAAPDITVDLGGTIVSDDQVAIDDLMNGIAIESFGGSLPAGVEVTAYHDDGTSGVLFSVDSATALPGGVFAGPEDVVRLDGGVFTLAFDGSSHGVPSGVHVDDVTRDSAGHLVLSFDTTVLLDGVIVEDEDLARFDGTRFTLALDGSAVGIDSALDTDGVEAIGPGVWALSFDNDGTVGGVTFADEDVVRVDTSGPGPTFALLFDGSFEHAGWRDADLHALPEPGSATSLLSGAVALVVLESGRRERARRSTSSRR